MEARPKGSLPLGGGSRLCNRSPPHGSPFRPPTLFTAVAAGPATGTAQATAGCTPPPPPPGHQQLTTLPMGKPFPHSFILGAKPGSSSASLENSTAGGGRDKGICAWLRPSVPRTHSVCGPPKGLNYFCSTGGQMPKIPGNGLVFHGWDW